MAPAQAADPTPVVFVPGGVNPAAITYGELLAVLKETVDSVLKDHELYAGDAPRPGWGLSFEVAAIRRAADAARFGTFHLVGYSGGGAISLAFVLAHGDRLRSLNPMVRSSWAQYRAQEERTMGLPMEDLMREFVKLALKPGVSAPAPPPGPPPPWMMKRPAGLRAFMAAVRAGDLD